MSLKKQALGAHKPQRRCDCFAGSQALVVLPGRRA